MVYASQCGSTAEVAQGLAGEFASTDANCEALPASSAGRPDRADAVVLGSAVRFGQWLPPAMEFAKRNRDLLSSIPVALFSVHIMALDGSSESAAHRETYLSAVREWIHPSHTAFFAGKIDPARLSLPERLIGRMVGASEGDFRDWDAIRAWARAIGQEIK